MDGAHGEFVGWDATRYDIGPAKAKKLKAILEISEEEDRLLRFQPWHKTEKYAEDWFVSSLHSHLDWTEDLEIAGTDPQVWPTVGGCWADIAREDPADAPVHYHPSSTPQTPDSPSPFKTPSPPNYVLRDRENVARDSSPLSPLRGEGPGVRGLFCSPLLHPLSDLFADHLNDLVSRSQDFIARNAHDPITLPLQKIVPHAIALLPGCGEMIRPSDFQD